MFKSLNSRIDHTNLSINATKDDIKRTCMEAMEYQFRGVCVNPIWVPVVFSILKDSGVKTVSVCDFPLGASFTAIRKKEAEMAINSGAQEIDIVIQFGLFKSGRLEEAKRDLEEIADCIHPDGKLKVIIEAPLLSDEEIKRAAKLVQEAGADFIKTGSGTKGPVTVHQVEVIKEVSYLPIKAAGGIRDKKSAIELIKSGASILGSSSGIKIVRG